MDRMMNVTTATREIAIHRALTTHITNIYNYIHTFLSYRKTHTFKHCNRMKNDIFMPAKINLNVSIYTQMPINFK